MKFILILLVVAVAFVATRWLYYGLTGIGFDRPAVSWFVTFLLCGGLLLVFLKLYLPLYLNIYKAIIGLTIIAVTYLLFSRNVSSKKEQAIEDFDRHQFHSTEGGKEWQL